MQKHFNAKMFLALIILLCAGQGWCVDYTVCSSGCTATTLGGVLSGNDVNGDDTIELRADSVGGTKIFYDTGVAWAAADGGSDGHQVVLKVRSGDTVILSGGWDTSAWEWTDAGGGVFSKSGVTTETKCFVFNGARLTKNASTPTTPAAGEYGWAVNVLYVNVDGASSPATGVYKVGKQNYPLLIQADYVTIQGPGLTFEMGNATAGGVIYVDVQVGIVLDNFTARYSATSQYGIYFDTVTGSISEIKYCTVHTVDNGIYARLGSDYSIHHNTVYNIGVYSTTDYAGIYCITDGVPIYSNTVYNVNGKGISINNADSDDVYLNEVYGNYRRETNGTARYYPNGGGGGIVLNGDSSSNTIHHNFSHGNYQGIFNDAGTGTGGNSFTENISYGELVNGIGNNNDPGINHIVFYNNSVYQSPAQENTSEYTGHALYCQTSCKKATFANNLLIVNPVAQNCNGLYIIDGGGLVEVLTDYNLLYPNQTNANIGRVGTTDYTTLATWKAAVQGYSAKVKGLDGVQASAESHSVAGTTPPCVDPANGNFNLKGNSTATDAGVAITGLHTAGNTDVDIGAYETACIKEGPIVKIKSSYPPITGTITGGDYSGNTHIYNCR